MCFGGIWTNGRRSRPLALRSLKGDFSSAKDKILNKFAIILATILVILLAGRYIAQFLRNYTVCQDSGGHPGDGAIPESASSVCFLPALVPSLFHLPYRIIDIGICVVLLVLLLVIVMRMGYSDTIAYNADRNFTYSTMDVYGSSGWMTHREMNGVL